MNTVNCNYQNVVLAPLSNCYLSNNFKEKYLRRINNAEKEDARDPNSYIPLSNVTFASNMSPHVLLRVNYEDLSRFHIS